MEDTGNKGVIYEFDGFVLDPDQRTLTINGTPVHLPAKEFHTLLYLLEHRGRTLTKEELMSAIWQDAFVEEANLAKQISKLRKLLGAPGSSMIQTIPKYGYRLNVTDLRLREPDPLDPVVVEKRTIRRVTVDFPDPPGNRVLPAVNAANWKRRGAILLVLAVLLAGAMGAAIYLWSGHKAVTVANVRSLAVLPVGGVGGDENIRLGLTDALITNLSGVKQIIVRPTNAVRDFGSHDPMAAGQELGVDAVLNGNVQRVGQQIRVTVQLVSVPDGRLLWGGTFNERSADIFHVQDAIAEQAAAALELQLTGEDRQLIAKRYTTDPEAHYAYVRGRFVWNKRTAESLREAVAYFTQAIEKDPNYALAYAGLADTYSLLADYHGAPGAESYENARTAALRAMELDPDLAEAHTSLAYVKMYADWDWDATESGYRRAITLNPNYATAHQWYSEYLTGMGRLDEALAEIRLAKEIDPLSPVINAGEVWVLYYGRRYDEAIDLGKQLTEMNPDFAEVFEYLKRCYDQKGMFKEAVAARQMRRKLAGFDPAETAPLKIAAAATDPNVYWRSRLEQEIADSRSEAPANFDMAAIYARLGEKDRAFEWLEKAVEERTYMVMYLNVDPTLDPLRSDPRFVELQRRLGLPV